MKKKEIIQGQQQLKTTSYTNYCGRLCRTDRRRVGRMFGIRLQFGLVMDVCLGEFRFWGTGYGT